MNIYKGILLSQAFLILAIPCSGESEHAKDINRLDHAARILKKQCARPISAFPDTFSETRGV